MSKTKNKIRVSFVGSNAEDVTGSCIHIKTDTKQILLECGLYQSCSSLLNTYKVNNEKFKFKPKDIDYIFVNHNHIDHIGKIPKLYAQGCTAQIIAPKGTYDIAKILLEDCAYIMSKDVETLKRKTGKDYQPIYTIDDVHNCLQYWNEYDFEHTYNLSDNGENIVFCFQPSSHILNSAQLELWLRQNGNLKKIIYSSDIGSSIIPKYYVNKFKPLDKSTLFIGECTYSNELKSITLKDREKDLEKIKSVIQTSCIDNHAKVLFPVFANDRLQNMLTYLYDLFGEDENFNAKILVDSNMGVKISKTYLNLLEDEQLEKWNKVYHWKNVKFIEDYETSKYYQELKEPMIILAASGMLTAGRAISWVSRMLSNSKNHIIFCGYSPANSLAGKIKSGNQKTITIDGKAIPNRCGITALKSFSSHAQRNELLKYYSELQTDKLALVHSDMDSKIQFSKELQDEVSKKNRSYKVIAVNKSTEILL